jgi:two-component system response regulator HydG
MAIQDLNYYWKKVVDTIQDGVMIVNTQGTIVSVNRAFEEITGYAQDEVIGATCNVLNCSACEIARNEKGWHWCVLFRQGELRKKHCVLMRKDGKLMHVVKNACVLKDPDGTVSGAVETLTDVTELVAKEHQIATYRRELNQADTFHGMIGGSVKMRKVFDMVADAAQSDAPVIIYGESGTGKELIARAIHEAGPRREHPYVKVNCAALNESLLESELFGHVKGAYTGALRDRAGRFEVAREGSIFLDEIGDLPMSTQVKLLRVLEEKVIERVGDQRAVHVDVRIISATNRDLPTLIREGAFREDFYYRINVIPIWLPPLRERVEDIPLLATAFFRRIQLKSGKAISSISKEAMQALMRYAWPGNVRELKSAFEFAFVSCRDTVIEPENFPAAVLAEPKGEGLQRESAAESLDAIKKQRLAQALRKAGGNQSQAARILGISRTSVYNQMKRYHLRS